MSDPNNPFDKTVWDPENPEQAIEDPFHGPTAVHELLKIPPMKLPDGTYHVFGGYYLCGTNSFDAEGRPFIKFKTAGSGAEMFHEAQKLGQWVEAFHKDELPPREDLDLPEFQYHLQPYFVFEKEDRNPIEPVIKIDVEALTKSQISPEELERIQQDFEAFRQQISSRTAEPENLPVIAVWRQDESGYFIPWYEVNPDYRGPKKESSDD